MLRKDESNFIGATLSWGWMTGHLADPFQFHSCNFSILKIYVDVARIKLEYLKTNQGTKLYLIKGH